MRFKFLLFFSNLCWVFQINSAEVICSEDIHIVCPNKDIYEIFSESSFSILKDEMLIKHCRDIIMDIECKSNFLLSCQEQSHSSYVTMTNGIKGVFTDMCNETSSLRRDYLLHGPCMSNQTEEYDECLLNSIVSVAHDESENFVDKMSSKKIIERFCRLYRLFKDCATTKTRENCGDAAADHFDILMTRAIQDLQNAKCSYLDI
ncbi:uncharacterized protein [Parasteatoda tepidariorum]|uniref:uncharacterized protein n=1 Tax=Parasteatoda tepidariorum TaxID=114398 RepID=UPI00077FBAED|nr:uncharacterized protein LOC107456137 [Parasteatoda tepidariorum]